MPDQRPKGPTVAVCVNSPITPSSQPLIEAWFCSGAAVEVLHTEECPTWPAPDSYDLVHYRIIHLSDQEYSSDIIKWLGEVPLLSNSLSSIAADRDKLLGGRLLLEAGLPVPPFIPLNTSAETSVSKGLLGGPPYICKPVRGGRGDGVVLVRSVDEALTHQERVGRECLLQRYIPTRRCARVLCTSETVLAAYAKVTDDIVASVTLGAAREEISESEDAILELGLSMARAVQGDVVGADILEAEDGSLWALEANTACPGFDPERTDIANIWVDYLIREHLRH